MLAETQTIIIENVYPEVDSGRYPAKREQGEVCEVWADIFKEGHDAIAAVLKYRRWDEAEWREAPLRLLDDDRWRGEFPLAENNRYVYTIEAWHDAFASWRHDVSKKSGAGQDVAGDLLEGAALARAAASRAEGEDARRLRELAEALAAGGDATRRVRLGLAEELAALMAAYPDRSA